MIASKKEGTRSRRDGIAPAVKYLKVVIPAEAGIQKNTGYRIKAHPGLDPGSGMTESGYLVASLITIDDK